MNSVKNSLKALVAAVGAGVIPLLPVIQDELNNWTAGIIAAAVTGVGVWFTKNFPKAEEV